MPKQQLYFGVQYANAEQLEIIKFELTFAKYKKKMTNFLILTVEKINMLLK